MARAELVMDKLEVKLAKSVGRGKTIKGRKVLRSVISCKFISCE